MHDLSRLNAILQPDASDRDVLRKVYKSLPPMMRRSPAFASMRRELYRVTLQTHHENQDLYRLATKGDTDEQS